MHPKSPTKSYYPSSLKLLILFFKWKVINIKFASRGISYTHYTYPELHLEIMYDHYGVFGSEENDFHQTKHPKYIPKRIICISALCLDPLRITTSMFF